jgi:two-component system sensor histidine kinase BaeS
MVPRSPAPDPSETVDADPDRLRRTVEEQAQKIEELQRQVDELSRRRTLFLSSSAHELKTPLTVLQVYLETLRDELAVGMSKEQLSFIEICHESVLRLRRLVLDLVDLAAIESGRVSLQLEGVDVEEAVQGVAVELRALADRVGVSIEVDVTGSPVVRADELRLQQIVRNFVDNAIKNTPAGGRVTVAASADGDVVRISVSDTGIGIPADRLESIFEEFVRFAPSDETGGSGLGLAVCSRLTDAMDGKITVTSTEGEGSTFTVELAPD